MSKTLSSVRDAVKEVEKKYHPEKFVPVGKSNRVPVIEKSSFPGGSPYMKRVHRKAEDNEMRPSYDT